MPPGRPRILYVTDLAYQARGRRYGDEDVFLTSRLRESFALALCHPGEAAGLMDAFDAVVVRNSGPVLGHQEACAAFRRAAQERGTRVYNPLTGKADMAASSTWSTSPRPDSRSSPPRTGPRGCTGCRPRTRTWSSPSSAPTRRACAWCPRTGCTRRWPRRPGRSSPSRASTSPTRSPSTSSTTPSSTPCTHRTPIGAGGWSRTTPPRRDLAFARRFIDWNGIGHGIQRVDACRAPDGALLLVELEDLNPYLSLDALDQERRDAFVAAMTASLHRFLAA
ncbi:hypothetical protein GCM10020295_19040 [Streptomyces cinereospinus]